MLRTRLVIGALLIAALLLSLWIDAANESPYASFILLVLFGTAGAVEWNRIIPRVGGTYPGLLVFATVLYPFVELLRIREGWPQGRTDFLFLFLFLFVLLGRAVLAGHVQDGLDRIARTLLGFMLLFLFYRLVPVLLDPDVGGGLLAGYSLVLTSKSCDIGAFLTGYTLGRRKLIPKVSPGKTVAGAAGGLLLAMGVGAATVRLMDLGSLHFGLLFGLVLGMFTMLSDLAESLVKRCAGVKDSANLLPQFGGVLDLIDSLFLAAPAGYLILVLFR